MKRCWIHWAGDTLICRRQLGGYRIEIGLALLLWFSRSVVPNTLRPHGLQQPRFPGPSPSPGACSNSFYWISDAIQPSYPLSSPSPPSFNLSKIRVFSIRDWPAYSWSTSTSPGTRGKPPAQRPQRGSSELAAEWSWIRAKVLCYFSYQSDRMVKNNRRPSYSPYRMSAFLGHDSWATQWVGRLPYSHRAPWRQNS